MERPLRQTNSASELCGREGRRKKAGSSFDGSNFEERCRCHGRRRRSTRVSPTTLFSCRHADALSLASYPQHFLCMSMRHTIIQTSFWVSFLVPNLASSRTYVRHGPLLQPHRSSRLLPTLAMDYDHTSASSCCLSQDTAAVSVELSLSDRLDVRTLDGWQLATFAVGFPFARLSTHNFGWLSCKSLWGIFRWASTGKHLLFSFRTRSLALPLRASILRCTISRG